MGRIQIKVDATSSEGIFVMVGSRLAPAGALCSVVPLAIGLTFPIQLVSGVTAAGVLSLVPLATLTVVALSTKRIVG